MCFVWISEQTAIISLYNINWLVCVTETECVYCAVRTGSLVLHGLQHNLLTVPWLMQLFARVSPQNPGFDFSSVHVRLVMDKVALWEFSLQVLQFSPVSIIPPMLHTHSYIYHQSCIMFLSQYFSFPMSVSFHQCSILIHTSTTHAV
jgi:hypothetical protein